MIEHAQGAALSSLIAEMFAPHPQVLTDPLAAGAGAGQRCPTGGYQQPQRLITTTDGSTRRCLSPNSTARGRCTTSRGSPAGR
ncbi:MAG: hypothetical protein ACRDRU_23000 [Pseudonocardiaceae bacterium]